MNPEKNLIRFDGVRLCYGRTAVLDRVSCSVKTGSFTALAGPNGSGKTTFLRAALGIIRPDAGTIEMDRSRPCAYVPQADSMNLLWPMTVSELVFLPLRSRRAFGKVEASERRSAEEALNTVGLFAQRDSSLRALSGGQLQRAVLAQALAQDPGVLLLDEPTQGLDTAAERAFLDLLSKLNRERKTSVLLVTHSLTSALNDADSVLLFARSTVIESSPEGLMKPGLLEDIYGTAFVRREENGLRWLAAEPKR